MKKTLIEFKKELATVNLRLTLLSEQAIEISNRGEAMAERRDVLEYKITQIEESLRND